MTRLYRLTHDLGPGLVWVSKEIKGELIRCKMVKNPVDLCLG